jgi:lysozyme
MGTSASAQSAATVRVDPSSLSAQVNDNGYLSIKVDNIANLTAIELHLSFNPSVMEVLQVTNGGFVVADFTAQNVFDNTAGTIDYAVAQLNRTPAQGSGILFNIVFRAKAAGVSTIALRATDAVPSGLLLSDQNGTSIQSSWMGGSVNVGGSPTPTHTQTVPTNTFTPTPTHTQTGPTNTFTPTPTHTQTGPTNTFTPTPTHTPTGSTSAPTATPVSTTSSGSVLGIHTIRAGEWIFCIGRAYGVSPWAIIDSNGVWWPYIVFPNQQLTIPNVPWVNMSTGPVCQAQFTTSTSTTTATATATSTPTTTPTGTILVTVAVTSTPTPTTTSTALSTCRVTYIVLQGDTLYHIAAQYGTSVSAIASVNQISDPTLIYVGQQLCIP